MHYLTMMLFMGFVLSILYFIYHVLLKILDELKEIKDKMADEELDKIVRGIHRRQDG